MLKRTFDVVVSFLLLLLLLPLLLAVALWVKLDSPGPVLFRQQRVGRYGVPFLIHKFRSMRSDATTQGPLLTVGNDTRITRAGRFLRDSRIDELPQLFDVLRGTMSLVGPRPEVPRYVAHYPADLRDRVLAVRPGVTDPASLANIDEAQRLAAAADPEREYIEHILPSKLAQSAAYADGASLMSDLAVLWRSLCLLFSRTKPKPYNFKI